ncbi:MAG: type II toxin-antitoxin system VapC family toxin [Deltaproteobacteria bacterium]|nr:type II toxin-antitoxin system VapC family toxin [Deltaproteobacteria bacterium]
MKKILLDTNAYVRFLAGDREVLAGLATAGIVYMSVVVLGELYAGFRGGKKEVANRKVLEQFLSKPTVRVLEVTQETSEVFGEVKALLKKTGTPLPINDVWIAAHALETGTVLFTYDRHFQKVPGVRLWERVFAD